MKAVVIIRNDDDEIMVGNVSAYEYAEYTGLNIFRGTFILSHEINTKQDFLRILIDVIKEIFRERSNK